MHYGLYYTANAHMKRKHSLDATDERLYPSGKSKNASQTFLCQVDHCATEPCRSNKRTKFKSAAAANKHMRKQKVNPSLLYPEQDAPSAAAVQAEVTTPHIQTSISHATSTHTVQTK